MTSVDVIGDTITRLPVSSNGLPDQTHAYGHAIRAAQADPLSEVGVLSGATARQELLWGADGQAVLRESHVVVVGNGGTGSHVVSQLAHLGVGHLTLIDHDVVETSNLSRLIGATPTDVGRPKADVLAELVRAINPAAEVTPIARSVLDVDPAVYTGADVIVCATDGHDSRSLLTEVCVQYLVPVVDLGVEIVPDTGAFRAGGGVRVLRPGLGCLWCAGTLLPALVREEYLDEEQRARETARGYIRDRDVPAPSVVALNGVVSSFAVLEVCQLLVGMLGSGRSRLLLRAEQRAVTTVGIGRRAGCHVCGDHGVFGRGDAAPVKTRWQARRDAKQVRRLG
jgi:molybdopterin/thiamine biosynthesis adenylyltransferase